MKKYSFLFLTAMALLWGCSDDDKPKEGGGETPDEPSVEISSLQGDEGSAVYATSATLNLKANGVESYAYQLVEGEKTDSPVGEVIYAVATEEGGSGIKDLKDGDNNITIYGLEGNKTYTIFFAFKVDKDYILKQQVITTPAYTRIITPISITKNSIKFHVELDENTYYKYGVTNLFDYTAMKENFGGTDVDFIKYGTILKGAQTIEVKSDPDGLFIYPGMASVVLLGECNADGELLYTFDNGDMGGELLSTSPLGNIGEYTEEYTERGTYEGKYARLKFWTEAPEIVENTMSLEILRKTETSIKLAVTPGEGVVSYGVGIVEGEEYEWILNTVTEKGINSLIFYNFTEGFTNPEEISYDRLTTGSKYKIYIIANYNENDYNRQSVLVHDVEMTKSTLPEVQLDVNLVQSNDPYSVTFNVKAPNKDCYGIRFLMNYTEDWKSAYYDDETMLSRYGVDVKDEAFIKGVNSNEGYDIHFDSWENTESRMILVAYNEEEGKSQIYEVTGTSAEEIGTPMTSDLFEKLSGTWTAAYSYKRSGADNSLEFPITFTQEADEGPANVNAMNKTDYDNLLEYWKKTGLDEATAKARIEETFEDYKISAQKYAQKYKNMNRLVGNGFKPLSEYNSTWDLFCNLKYSAATSDDLFYDYGPKIFFQVFKNETTGKDEVVLATYEYAIPPMLAFGDYEYYMLGYNTAPGSQAYKNVNFPVTLSEDGNEMVIHSIEDEQVGYTLYPSACYYMMAGYPSFYFIGTGDIVLTKGGSAVSQNASKRAFGTFNPADVKLMPAHRSGNRFMKTYIPSEKTVMKYGKTIIHYTPFDKNAKKTTNWKLK